MPQNLFRQYQLSDRSEDELRDDRGMQRALNQDFVSSGNVIKTSKTLIVGTERTTTIIDPNKGVVVNSPITRNLDLVVYAATITLEVTRPALHSITTTSAVGNSTINASSVGSAGQIIYLQITNDAAASRSVTFGTNFTDAGILYGSPGKTILLTFISDGTTWRELSRSTWQDHTVYFSDVDGTADDVQIQSALDAANTAGGGLVWVQGGRYSLSSTLTIGSNTHLKGSGRNFTILSMGEGLNYDILRNKNYGNASVRNSTIVVSDLQLDHNKESNTAGAVVSFNETEYCSFINNWFQDADFTLDGSDYALVANNLSLDSRGIGITVGAGGETPGGTPSIYTRVVHNVIHSTGTDGIYLDLASVGCVVDGNEIIHAGRYGIIADNSTDRSVIVNNVLTSTSSYSIYVTQSSHYCEVLGNVIADGGASGIYTDNECDWLRIVGNTIASSATNGIDINEARFTEITGNSVGQTRNHGIFVGAGANDGTITGNTIVNSGLQTHNTYRDVYLNGAVGWTVNANVMRSMDSTIAVAQNIITDGASDFNTIVGNQLSGAASAAVSLVGSNNRVGYNRGHVTENRGTGSIASGTTNTTITHGLNVTPVASNVFITPTNNPTNDYGNVWVDTITSTQFNVNVRSDPGASGLNFSWQSMVPL